MNSPLETMNFVMFSYSFSAFLTISMEWMNLNLEREFNKETAIITLEAASKPYFHHFFHYFLSFPQKSFPLIVQMI